MFALICDQYFYRGHERKRAQIPYNWAQLSAIQAQIYAFERNWAQILRSVLIYDVFSMFTERAERVKKDKGAAIREIFEAVNEQWAKGLVPSDYMTIHETHYPCRNRVSCVKVAIHF